VKLIEPEIIKLPDIDLSDNPDIQTAAKLIFGESLKHLKDNFARFQKKEDAKALMQIRIGMRRIRVAMMVFRQIIPNDVRSRFNREFRYFGNMLGDARNMDVFLEGVLAPGNKTKPLKKAFQELTLHGETLRADEYEIIKQEISGGHFKNLLKSFDKWLNSKWSAKLGKAAKNLLEKPVAPFALKIIDEGSSELLNQGSEAEHLSASELHDVRKYAKRARYHLRFFSSLFAEEKVQEGFAILIHMQDCLGHINDVKEGVIMLGQLAENVRADYFADVLRLNAKIIENAADSIDDYLEEFAILWEKYEAFSIGEDDLKIKA
jgi:CHAD domain-containing protein